MTTTAHPAMDHRRLRERLARHRGEAEPVAPMQAASDCEPEVDWQARIGHLRQLIQARRRRLGGPGAARALAMIEPPCSSVAEQVAVYDPGGEGRTYDPASIGRCVSDGVRLVDQRLELSEWLPAPDHDGAGPLLCFDTETTGLRGGAGLWVWMVGVLIWRDGHWRLHQWWLERPGVERRYLELLLEDFKDAATLVSFNGKSYDVPHLGTRLALNGLANPLPDLTHIDLLHAARRRYRTQWPDCRLRTAEERLLDLVRSDDLPGSEAPRSWREYLTMGRCQGIAQVLAHNRQDLLSLARLMPLLGVESRAEG